MPKPPVTMLTKLEEITLITRCVAADDRRAFGRLVDEHSPALRNFLFRLTMGDAALTDDLSQDTFVKAWTGLKSFKAISRFRTWLLSIAYNEFVGYCRRRREERLDEMQNVQQSLAVGSESGMRRTEMRHDVEVALTALNETERTLIVLFYMDDMPIKDISRVTGLPTGTIKSYLSRAKTKMAKHLTQDEKGT